MTKNKIPKFLDHALASETLKKLGNKQKNKSTTISEIIEDFHENGILLAIIFFSLPVAIPLPYPPGFTTIMGIPLIVLSVQMLIGSRKVKLPQKINAYKIKNSTLKTISDKTVPILLYVEKYVKPRVDFAKSIYCEQLVGFICLIASLAVIIPLPLTNAIPAQGIFIMTLGLLNRDGVVIGLGALLAIFGLIVAIAIMIAGLVALKYLFFNIF